MSREASERRAERQTAALLRRNVVTRIIALLRSLVVVPLVSPAEYGLFKYILTLCSYSRQLHAGILSGYAVRYAERDGAGDIEQCRALQALAWQAAAIGALLFPPIAFGLLFHAELSFYITAVVAMLAGVPLLASYVSITLQSHGDFEKLAVVEMAASVSGFVLLLAGTWFFGLEGLVVAALLSAPLIVLLGRSTTFPPGWRRLQFSRLPGFFGYGLRLWGAGLLTALAATIDIVILGQMIGTRSAELGFYTLGLTIAAFLGKDLKAITQVQLRRLQFMVGEAGGVRGPGVSDEFRAFLARDALVAIWLAGGVMFGTALLLPVVLPAYAAAVPLAGLFLVATIFSKWQRYCNAIFALDDRAILWAIIAAITLGATAALFVLVHTLGDGAAAGFAATRVVIFGFVGALSIAFAARRMGSPGAGVGFIVRLIIGHSCLALLLLPALFPGQRLLAIAVGPGAVLASVLLFRVALPGTASAAARLLRETILGVFRRRRAKNEVESAP